MKTALILLGVALCSASTVKSGMQEAKNAEMLAQTEEGTYLLN